MPTKISETKVIEQEFTRYKCEFCEKTYVEKESCIWHEAHDHAGPYAIGTFIYLKSADEADRYATKHYSRPSYSQDIKPGWYHMTEVDSGDYSHIYFDPIDTAIKEWEEKIEEAKENIENAKRIKETVPNG